MGSLLSRLSHRSTANSQDEAAENEMYIAVALCNIPPDRNSSEDTIHIGERVNILSEEGDMLRISSASDGIESFVHRTVVSKVYSRWLFEGISRRNAEELLLLPQNHTGSFIIRKSQTCPGSYSLSVRQNGGHRRNIKHYRILQLHNGWFCIHPSHPFSTLNHLVDYYKCTARGIVCRLTEPCLFSDMNPAPEPISAPIVIQRPNLNWREVTRSMIQRRPKRTHEETLVSEGLRETVNAYIYFTEESCCDD